MKKCNNKSERRFLQQFPVKVEMLCRSGSRPTSLSGESPTYSFFAGNSGAFRDAAFQYWTLILSSLRPDKNSHV